MNESHLTTLDQRETNAVVEIRQLSKSYEEDIILNNVDLFVKAGENLTVLGKSGSGKSTLIKCIIGLVEPDQGEIRVFGEDIVEMKYRDLNEVRKRIGFLFQGAALYDSMTVRENLRFPLKHNKRDLSESEIEDMIAESLEQVGLLDSIDKMPAELSGGMTKRIGVARTLILNPEIMLYDEPTTGLDTATAKEISELILEMQRKNKISSIIITHDMACAKLTADRIVMLKEGVIEAEGTYEELEHSDDPWTKSFFT